MSKPEVLHIKSTNEWQFRNVGPSTLDKPATQTPAAEASSAKADDTIAQT
jgi:hypothetical protein